MINFISLIDSRLNDLDITLDKAIKLRWYHETQYGAFKSYIEIDGVEYDG